MEENEQNQANEQESQQVPELRTPEVGFPVAQPKQKMQGGTLIFIGLGLLILIGLGIFLFAKGSKQSAQITPTPTQFEETSTPTETGTPTPTLSPTDKTKIKIEVQNGTGITGEAAYLQGKLRTAGYTSITVGNAPNQNVTSTTVTFGKSLSAQVVADVTKLLEGVYQDVQTKTSSTQAVDILIVTGLRTGATPKPTGTTTTTPTATPTTAP